ncbi:hypothetical protein V1525DRAFT_407501 [Lipomyces kononenkoae]|uniref:Uncharacterized protein n=1 Tax=Lipomyces kononenkoae TaxID=34357 RepID=A0ACC3SX97_LIPKO
MSSLFQAITRPADDFRDARSGILNGIGGTKTPRGAHKITLVDHTISPDLDALNLPEHTGSEATVDGVEPARKHDLRIEQHQELVKEPNTAVEASQEGEASEHPKGNKHTDDGLGENQSSAILEDEDPTGGLEALSTNESAPLLPGRGGNSRNSIVIGRRRKRSRKCMDLQPLLQPVLSAVSCCMPWLFVDMEDEGYNTWNEQHEETNSIVPARIRHEGYSRLKDDQKEMAPDVGKGIFSSDPNVKYDILYENQRGFFAFGTPFFSSASLLHYDPSPWVDGDYKYSPVDILSAPVPDPSWEWVWRTWYIDMTYDVDDQGWSYSLSFTSDKWHGAHVWFHAFVRRRRWIRKRRRIGTDVSTDSESYAGAVGTVNQGSASARREVSSVLEGNATEYFSVQSAYQGRSRKHAAVKNSRKYGQGDNPCEIVAAEAGDAKASPLRSHLQQYTFEDDDDSLSDESEYNDVRIKKITSMGELLRRLKKARLDRQKIEAVERFVRDGDEDVVLLASFMDQVISFLIFQESRRELLRCLLNSYQQVRRAKRQCGKFEGDDSEGDHAGQHPGHVLVDTTHLTTREIVARRKALHDAILVAKREIMKLDYYSDRKMSSKDYARADLIWSGADDSQNPDIEITKKAMPVEDRILNEGLEEVEEEWSEDMEDENGDVSSERTSPATNDDGSTVTPRISVPRVDKGKGREGRIPLTDINATSDNTDRVPDTVGDEVQQEQNATVANVRNKVINFVASS